MKKILPILLIILFVIYTPAESPKIMTATEIAQYMSTRSVHLTVLREDGTYIHGSGFYISPDGNIATNYHVIANAKKICTTSINIGVRTAEIISEDRYNDWAIIDIDATTDYVVLSDNDPLIGQTVYAYGCPNNIFGTLTEGIVANKNTISGRNVILADITTMQGSSGSVLLNEQGEAVGILKSKMDGFAVAVPIEKIGGMK